MIRRAVGAAVTVLVLAALAVGFAYAGSPGTLARGVRIAGVDVGGLTTAEARRTLRRRSRARADVAVTFRIGQQTFELTPRELGVEVDWAAAVFQARREGDGFGPLRGFRRLEMRFFGVDVTPRARAWKPAVDFQLARLARAVDRPHREAALRRKGLEIVIVPAQPGRVLNRRAAARVIVPALASFDRPQAAIRLPLRIDPPEVRKRDLARAAARARLALSAPVRLRLGGERWTVSRRRIATMLVLPRNGSRAVSLGGPLADRYFARLAEEVYAEPKNAELTLEEGRVRIIPSVPGRVLDDQGTAEALFAAATSPGERVARVAVKTKAADRTTAEAKAMGITGVVGSYTTEYGGIPNRLHNVRLVARLIDDKLIPPGATFSFNETTGARTPEKGFKEAPVIINGELQTALGGGVCQVSTTVFNAAYEAGLPITARTNHALYISHYPRGRDATVNYPDTDLRFVNDTGKWLWLRTFVGDWSLTVNLYGAPTGRRVESESAALRVVGGPPVRKIKDPALEKGEVVVEESGSSALATSAHRKVYDASGKLLYDDVWYSTYQGEWRVVRVGTKPKPKLKPVVIGGVTALVPVPVTPQP